MSDLYSEAFSSVAYKRFGSRQVGGQIDNDQAFLQFSKRHSFLTNELDEDYHRIPYTIPELIQLKKRINEIVENKEAQVKNQCAVLLTELYRKSSFKMALLTLIRSKPVASFKAGGLIVLSISIVSFLINFISNSSLIHPYITLLLFYFGAGVTFVATAEQKEINKSRKNR